jgi:hypothetical protein
MVEPGKKQGSRLYLKQRSSKNSASSSGRSCRKEATNNNRVPVVDGVKSHVNMELPSYEVTTLLSNTEPLVGRIFKGYIFRISFNNDLRGRRKYAKTK